MGRVILFVIIGLIILVSVPIVEIYLENFMAYSAVDQINNVDDSRWLLKYNDYLPTVFTVLRMIGIFFLSAPLHKKIKTFFSDMRK